jgi:hypothetical protein
MASPVRTEAAPAAKTKLHSRSVAAADCIIPLRDARRNCLNLKGVIAIKLIAPVTLLGTPGNLGLAS